MERIASLKKSRFNHYGFQSLLPYKWSYGLYLVCVVVSVPIQLLVILLLSHAITLLQTQPHSLTWVEIIGEHAARWLKPFVRNTPWQNGMSVFDQYTFFPICLIASSVTLLFLKVVSEWCIEWVSERVAADLRNGLTQHYLKLEFVDALKVDKGSLGTRIAEDTREARLALTRVLGSIPTNIFSSVFFITWLVLLDTQLFFLFVSILTPSIFIIRWVTKILKGLSKEGLNSQSGLHDALLEKLTHWQTIRSFEGYGFELQRFSKDNDYLYKIWRRATRAKSLSTPLIEWLATMAGSCVVVVALKRISENALSQSAFTSFLVTVGYLASSLQEVSTQITHSRKGAESWRRLHHFGKYSQNSSKGLTPHIKDINQDSEDDEKRLTIEVRHMQLENLSKSNQTGKDLFLNPIDLKIETGDFWAIYGPSGVGKTTFIAALLGLIPTKSGSLTWRSGRKTLSLEDLNFKLIHYISQDPFLFQGSVFENIVYPYTLDSLGPSERKDFEEKAFSSLELSCLNVLLEKPVNSLSGGEKQRVALARAFFHRCPVLIIDEGTSALDPVSEEKILCHLKDYSKNALIIMVTHRMSVLKFCSHSIELVRRK